MREIKNDKYNFYYEKEAEQFSFYRIPKMLFTEARFKKLSSEAKILYGLLLDRMSLSVKNGWLDEENRVYIYYTAKEVMESLNVAKEKCTKIFAELDCENGCGLITKIKQGLGKPDMIYVMNFVGYMSFENEGDVTGMQDEQYDVEPIENSSVDDSSKTVPEIESPEFRKSKFKKFENRTSVVSKIKCLEVRKSNTINTELNNTNNNYTDFSNTNLILSNQKDIEYGGNDVMDEIRERDSYRKLVADNIEYDVIARNYGSGDAEGILETMIDAICCKKDYLVVAGSEFPKEIVKSRLLKLDYCHIAYVLDCLKKNKTKIYNIKSYLLTALYNSLATIEHYYTAEVNHDFSTDV